jgi:TonB-linked SusC/RagA family outer membrane protein
MNDETLLMEAKTSFMKNKRRSMKNKTGSVTDMTGSVTNKTFAFVLCLLWMSCLPLSAQSLTVKGNIAAKADGLPIIGATVVEKGENSTSTGTQTGTQTGAQTGAQASTQNGTVTDADGNFTLTVSPGAWLTISYIGYKQQTVKAQPTLRILLEEDTELLDEVVVTGYTTEKRADLTGSVAIIPVAALKSIPDTDPMRALQGRVAGMTIYADGSPSGVGTIRIRGIGSINSGQDPLFVIDGVPTNSTLNSLNTNDIESIQVLKDAASASIYGSRAANGVVIITTKHAKAGEKMKVDFAASLTSQFYATRTKVLDTAGYGQALVQAALNDGLNPAAYAHNYGYTVTGSGSKLSDYTITPGVYDGYLNASHTMLPADTDWFDVISETGLSQNYDVSLSSGSERGTMMFSLGYKSTDGILKYTDFNSIAARMNTSYNVGKYVTVGENFTVTYTTQVDNPGIMEYSLKIPSITPVYTVDGTQFGGPTGSMPDRQNPLRMLYHNRDNRLLVWRLFGNAYIDIHPIAGLTLRSNFGLDYDTAFRRNLVYTFQSDIVKNETAESNLTQANDAKWNWSNTAAYDFSIAGAHNISLLAGMEMYKQTRTWLAANKKGFDVETPEYMWPDAGTGVSNSTGSQTGYALVSFFGKVNYNYRNRYLASATLRYDGSSRFGKNNRYATFPAFTVGWRISDEPFMRDHTPWLNDLKLRASWGVTGNQAISNNARYGLYVADYGSDRVISTAYDIFGQGAGLFPSGFRTTQTTNPNLKWESATQTDIGVDFALFNQRLYGSVDVYYKEISDMLIQPAYLGALGEGGNSWVNGPSMTNKGFELTLGYRRSFGRDWSIDLNGNLSFFRNEVTWLPETTTGSYEHTDTETIIGHPFGARVGYVADGLFQSQTEVYASGQGNARVGGIRYKDLDDNGSIDSRDRTWIVNPIPDFFYGLNLQVSYRQLDLQMFWQGIYGVDVDNGHKSQTDFWSVNDVGSNKGERLLDAWRPDNTDSTIPALTTNNTADEGRFSTYFVENGSYLKLRSLQIGYNFTSLLAKLNFVRNARLYLSGQNLLTLKSSSFTGYDPESPGWAYPIPMSFTVGIQATF